MCIDELYSLSFLDSHFSKYSAVSLKTAEKNEINVGKHHSVLPRGRVSADIDIWHNQKSHKEKLIMVLERESVSKANLSFRPVKDLWPLYQKCVFFLNNLANFGASSVSSEIYLFK